MQNNKASLSFLSDEITFIRRMLGMSQDELCKRLNVSKLTLSRAENGTVSKTLIAKFHLFLTQVKNNEQSIRRAQSIAIDDFLTLCENIKI